MVRLAVAEASTTYHEQLKDDEDDAVSAAVKNYKEKQVNENKLHRC